MTAPRATTIAILAMGGEGGGVLADWLVDLAEHNGFVAQATSVPGVAQRTGATIYYVEVFPQHQVPAGAQPVLGLGPVPGELDIVVASELMEAGRALQRGLVSAQRTTFIASTHRVYTITERAAMGDGRVDSHKMLEGARAAARRFVAADFGDLAERAGSPISPVLYGALSASEALPFTRAQFEDTIRRGGVGVGSSLAAFAAGFDAASQTASQAALAPAVEAGPLPRVGPRLASLAQRIASEFPAAAHATLRNAIVRLADYQDIAYAGEYLDRLARLDIASVALLEETARNLALWMSYEDTIRVADLKTRATRFERVAREVRLNDDQLLAIHEFMHPRLEEICDTLPAGLGRWLLGSGWPRRLAERFTRKGRVIATTSLRGFLMLYLVAGMKRWRRGTLRYAAETQRIERWLAQIEQAAASNPRLAVEVAQCQQLVKGYGDTHARGLRNFESVMAAVQRAGAALAPATLRELRQAALADEHGDLLRATLARHALA